MSKEGDDGGASVASLQSLVVSLQQRVKVTVFSSPSLKQKPRFDCCCCLLLGRTSWWAPWPPKPKPPSSFPRRLLWLNYFPNKMTVNALGIIRSRKCELWKKKLICVIYFEVWNFAPSDAFWTLRIIFFFFCVRVGRISVIKWWLFCIALARGCILHFQILVEYFMFAFFTLIFKPLRSWNWSRN